MDSASSIDLVRWYYDAINRRDVQAYDGLFNPDVELVVPGVEGDGFLRMQGVAAVRGFDQIFTTALPDMRIEPLATVPDDDGNVFSRNRVTGTQTETLPGPGGDLPPSGRRVDATYVGTFTVHGGRITAQQIYYDQVGLQFQLGPLS
jgi:ketosteroid isomerase-like protein